MTALGLVLGGKASADLIRSGKSEARAAAVFEIDGSGPQGEVETILGGSLDDDQLIITRRICVARTRQRHVNGLPVAVATLQKLGERLVDIHGQLEGRALLDPDQQRELLDAYGGLDDQGRRLPQGAGGARDACGGSGRRCSTRLRRGSASGRLLEFERDELAAADPEAGRIRRAGSRGAAAEAAPSRSAPPPPRVTRSSTKRTARRKTC